MSVAADQVLEVFEAAAEENRLSTLRQHQTILLPPESEVWVVGDLHDNRRNFDKILRNVHLDENIDRHLILQELIHGDYVDDAGAEDSWLTLYRAAELKCDFPRQVHFLLANHDLAQVYGEGIAKAGRNVCESFTAGIKRDFGVKHDAVNVAITEFLLSLPLAARTPGGAFMCHSLPTDRQLPTFDFTVFDREITGADYQRRTGAAYQLIWGRHASPESAETFANKVGASVLVTGHQPQESGYATNGTKHLIIASDHNQGVYLPMQTSEAYDADSLAGRLVKFVSMDSTPDAPVDQE